MADLENIVKEYQDGLFRMAFFRTGSLHDAQDIVQDVFVRLFDGRHDLRGIQHLKSYLFRSVSNGCNDFSRRNRRRKFLPVEYASAERTAEETAYMEEYERIKKLMAQIPPKQAEVIRLKTVTNMSFREIAEVLGLSEATAKSRFRYGIEKIRAKIAAKREACIL